jgi:Rieske Fe-S protein
MSDEIRIPRRSIVNWLLGTGAGSVFAAALYPVLRFLIPPAIPEAETSRVLAGRVSELGGARWKIFRFGSDPGILLLTETGEYRAFAATCTHLDCTVQYRPDLRRIWCACHNGFYDMNGVNVGGPPPRPLAAYTVHVVGDDIYVSRA